MRLTIDSKPKREIFAALFQVLKLWTEHVTLIFEPTRVFIQAMDKSHIALSDISIDKSWFTEYESDKTTLSVNSGQFSLIISHATKHDVLEISFNNTNDDDNNKNKNDEDVLNIVMHSQESDNKKPEVHSFQLALIDVENDLIHVPEKEYDVDFAMDSKKFTEVLAELQLFGQDANIHCDEDHVTFSTSHENTNLKISVPVDDLAEYAIAEDSEVNETFSLAHIYKMCAHMKFGQTVNLSIMKDSPMLVKYDLGSDSRLAFYIAPKVQET